MKEFIRNKIDCLKARRLFRRSKAHLGHFPRFFRGIQYMTIENGVSVGYFARIENYDSYAGEKYSPNLIIGKGTLIMNNFTCLNAGTIKIGCYCMIASNVFISSENHGMNPENGTYISQPLLVKDVLIGNNVWLGEKVMIMPGVQLGDNVIVGGGSIVTNSFPDNVIIAGNPAKIIKIWNEKERKWIAP